MTGTAIFEYAVDFSESEGFLIGIIHVTTKLHSNTEPYAITSFVQLKQEMPNLDQLLLNLAKRMFQSHQPLIVMQIYQKFLHCTWLYTPGMHKKILACLVAASKYTGRQLHQIKLTDAMIKLAVDELSDCSRPSIVLVQETLHTDSFTLPKHLPVIDVHPRDMIDYS